MKKKKTDDRQMNIFAYLRPEEPPQPGEMNISARLRQAISAAIKKSGKDRIDICAEIYKLTGIEVPKSSLDGWSAESRDRLGDGLDYNGNRRWGIPAEVVPAASSRWTGRAARHAAGAYRSKRPGRGSPPANSATGEARHDRTGNVVARVS